MIHLSLLGKINPIVLLIYVFNGLHFCIVLCSFMIFGIDTRFLFLYVLFCTKKGWLGCLVLFCDVLQYTLLVHVYLYYFISFLWYVVLYCLVICCYVCLRLYIVLFHIDTCCLCCFMSFCNVLLYSFVLFYIIFWWFVYYCDVFMLCCVALFCIDLCYLMYVHVLVCVLLYIIHYI